MIEPPDELLEDLQAALPPEQPVSVPRPPSSNSSGSGSRRGVNGALSPHDHLRISDDTRVSVASTAIVVRYSEDEEGYSNPPFDDAQYSEVRKGPFYSPKHSSSSTPPPVPESTLTPPPPVADDDDDDAGGLSELDNLLAMLNDTQKNIQEAESQPKSSKSDTPQARPSVADLVDELSEVEHQVGGGKPVDNHSLENSGGTKRSNITASTATLELDELMQNLSKFEPADSGAYSKAHGAKGEGAPKSAMDDLSSMLGSLDQEMTHRHGVSTAAKGICAACNKQILAKVVNALNRQWHPEHFTCAVCDTELGHVTYYESDGRPYCEKDYHELYAPRCAYCNGPILERVMRALDKTWHPEHFFCSLCGKRFGPEGFHEKDGKAFCRECYYEKYAPRCRRCEKAIMEGFITAMNAQWHPECFSCKVCQVTFPRGNYFEHEGEPHCEIHYHASRGTLCASCQKPVTGKCITAMGKKWHPEHFTCAFCLKLLNKGTFKEHRHNPYCQPCFIKLFG